MDNLLTPGDVAAHLKLSRRTVIVWLQSGKLKGIKVGSQWRVREDALQQVLLGPGSPIQSMDMESKGWLGADLARLNECDPYDWEPGELDEGDPVQYLPGVGIVVERKKHVR